MENKLTIYNTLKRKKELFKPLNPPNVGLYVCGPTVYGEPHLGHARPGITYDVLFRYLKYLGYKVRYVRNITDVGHLESDADTGDDKIAKKARLEELEPMEIVQFYTNSYHDKMRDLNTVSPSIEPHASGHIIEQQAMVKKIIDNGYAYAKNGSIYFDVEKYNQKFKYGKLSGRVVEDLQSNTRELDGQSEKKNPFDFALWKKAEPEHIMRWPSDWGDGFPGWHLECSVMSTKYLGEKFDIHGGGMDLLFPHHECEIAQSTAAIGEESVQYWMHNNMVTIDGQKMGKSLGNFITLDELFSGKHKLLEQAYSPMTIRFFILQAHYRSTLDFSNKALQAAEKGLNRLFSALNVLDKLKTSEKSSFDIQALKQKCFDAVNDDLNTPILFAHLFDGVKFINSVAADNESITEADLDDLKKLYNDFVFEIAGLKNESGNAAASDNKLDEVMDILLNMRIEAKKNKDFATSDKIRDLLNQSGITIKDTKEGSEWEMK
ncbi:MAG: cysteine--tRNA ligase [Bacteroidetes bacterium 4572_117]|nr:MAG: cysteine--tRNA ligase [Bacteroidetes bacterium 4572_117]